MPPAPMGSPFRQVTPPSSNDESPSHLAPSFLLNAITSNPRGTKAHQHFFHQQAAQSASSSTPLFMNPSASALPGRLEHDVVSPASPPDTSSGDDSSGPMDGLQDELQPSAALFDVETADMLDYEYPLNVNTSIPPVSEESSPEALLLVSNAHLRYSHPTFSTTPQPSTKFTSADASPEPMGLSPFITFEHPITSSESGFDNGVMMAENTGPDGDSPGLGSQMRGLRVNSRLPSPEQKTVCPEDVMMDHDAFVPSTTLEQRAAPPNRTALFEPVKQDSQPRQLIASNPATLPYDLSLIGIPPEGKKTRVETQLKVDLQLLQRDTRTPAKGAFQWLQLPSHTVSRSRFRIPSLKNLPQDIPPEQVVHLEASVVCTSNHTKTVNICDLCIARERRRTHRNKDYKRKTSKKPRPPSPTPPDEAQRIVIFNCPELQPFETSSIPLPTRITCYCRHHGEKRGFTLVLVARDWQGTIVGQTASYNIVITDDHKAQQQLTQGSLGLDRRGSGGETGSGRTSRRSSFESEESDEITSGRRGFSGTMTTTTGQLPTPQGSSTNLHALPGATATKAVRIPKTLSMTRLNKMEPLSKNRHCPYPTPTGGKSHPAEPPTFMRAFSMNHIPTYASVEGWAGQTSYAGKWRGGKKASITAPTSANTSRSNSPPDFAPLPTSTVVSSSTNLFPAFASPEMNAFRTGIVSAPISTAASPEDQGPTSPLVCPQAPQSSHFMSVNPSWETTIPLVTNEVPGITIPADIPDIPATHPLITKLIPSEGPMSGGIEVTIIGQGFTRGVTPYFGDLPVPGIDYYPPTTIVAILPPSAVAGPVLVTLRDGAGRTVSDVTNLDSKQWFTYKNHSDRDLMELALQILGYNWWGKVDEGRNVAALIIGNQNSQQLPMTAGGSSGEALEDALLRCLDMIDGEKAPFLSERSKSGHTLLHYASMQGYTRFASALLTRGLDPSLRDNAGFTALHYAAWLGRQEVVERLVAENVGLLALKTAHGKTPEGLAADRRHGKIARILDRAATGAVVSPGISRVSSMASLRSSFSRGSLSEYFGGSEQDEEDVSEDGESLEGIENPDDGETSDTGEEELDLQMGSLGAVQRQPTELLASPSAEVLKAPEDPPRVPSPMERMVPISAVTAFFNDFFNYQRKAFNQHLTPHLPPTPATIPEGDPKKLGLVSDISDENYDDPPPAYSQHAPAPPPTKQVEKFSLATRLSLRGRYILMLTGMAKDAEFSPEELEAVKWNVKISMPNDYMLLCFWIPMLILFFGWTFYNWGSWFRTSEAVSGAEKIVELHE